MLGAELQLTLWRADAERPWFGRGSFWASSRGRAEWYLTTPGFGGPRLYQATVDVNDLLDLRRSPWSVIHERFLLDRDDYGPVPDHELFADLVPVFAAAGYQWAVFSIGTDEEWIRLAAEPVDGHLAAPKVC